MFAHNLHPTDAELELLSATAAAVAHCPTSNAALGSGLFPLARHVAHGVRVALGSDVGGGTGFSLVKEGLQAYFAQQLLGDAGLPLSATHLLHLATSAGARALGLADSIGDLSVGKEFDAIWLRPGDGSTFATGCSTRATRTTPWPRSSPSPRRRTWRGCGSAAPNSFSNGGQRRSKRSSSITLTQAATKSATNFAWPSSLA